jgi:hypothetical protein
VRFLIDKSPYDQCPQTRNKILSLPHLKNQVQLYSCLNKVYHHAQYLPSSSCSILPLIKSFQILIQRKLKLYFVGDSLMGQVYAAFLCASERYGIYNQISNEYLPELFLRPDIPCDLRCRLNATFLAEENLKGFHQRCYGCPEGVYHELNASYPTLSLSSGPQSSAMVRPLMCSLGQAVGTQAIGSSSLQMKNTIALLQPSNLSSRI